MKVRRNISLDADIMEMLENQAYERHTTVSQYITNLVLSVHGQNKSVEGQKKGKR